MARADTITLLSLDRYAEIVGVEPFAFNQIRLESDPAGLIIGECEPFWFQYVWQKVEYVSREELARAIKTAETMLQEFLGSPPAPTWAMDEVQYVAAKFAWRDGLVQTRGLLNPKGLPSFQTQYTRVLAGGRRRVESLATGVEVDYADPYGLGYLSLASADTVLAETVPATEIIAVPEGTAEADLDRFRIRGLRVTITGGIQVHLEGVAAKFARPILWEAPETLDGDDPGSYLEEIDVWRLYNSDEDSTYAASEFVSLDISTLSEKIQTGTLFIRQARQGLVSAIPATWTAAGWQVTSLCATPEVTRLYYRCGFPSDELGEMAPPLDRAVASLATALLDKPVCGCGHTGNLIEFWQSIPEDAPIAQLECPLGPQNGAYHAYLLVRNLLDLSASTI